MQDLTIEQLKFAREIGADCCRLINNGSEIDYYRDIDIGLNRYSYWGNSSSGWCTGTEKPIGWSNGRVFEIDFTLLDALSTDNKEQPLEWPVSEDLIGRKVRFDGYITGEYGFWGFYDDELYVIGRDADGVVGPLRHDGRSVGENYHNDLKFTLLPKESEEWPEGRQDVVGQNGNDGEHYEKPETTHDVSHHKRKDGTDLIDEWWNKYEPEVARVLMWEMVNKYNNRLGKKDPVHIEVAKMADYMARWSEKEFELIK